MFRKMLVSIALSVFAMTSFAGQTAIDTSGLTDAQIAELKAVAAQKVADAAKPASADNITAGVTLAATWGTQAAQAAEGFAKAMGIAAKELNVSINEFLASDAGKLTAILIIWKVAGVGLIKMLYAGLLVIVGLSLARVVYLRLFTERFEKVEYSRFGGLFKGAKMVRVPKSFKDMNEDGEWLAFWVMIALAIGSVGIGALII